MRQIPLGARGTSTLRVQPEHLADRFKDAILPQVLATPVMILVMENGVFLGATAAAYGMPLIVELGVFFDVLVAGLIVGIYTHRLQDAFDSVDTSTLTVLKE